MGLHTTSPVSPYLSLQARLSNFERSALDDAMWRWWRLVRFRAMRLTMFVLPHDLLAIAASAMRHVSDPFAARWLRDSGLSDSEFGRYRHMVDEALLDGPLTVREMRQILRLPQSVPLSGIVSRMCDDGELVGGAPPRSWRSSIRRYHRWHDVLPNVDLASMEAGAAITELVRRYVHSYGPVTLDDIAWWTGIAKGRCRAALDQLDAEVEAVAVDGWPGPMFRLGRQPAGAAPAEPVKTLPLLDPYVQGYRDRVRFLDPLRNGYVYDGGGNAAATLVSAGRIIGVWQVFEPAEVRYHLFDPHPRSLRRTAEAQLAAAGALYFGHAVNVVEIATMQPLSAEGGRSAAHPLDSQVHRASRRRRR